MNRERGFKLLEVIVASAIFFTVSFLFINLLPASFWATRKADNLVTAHAAASSKLELLKSGPFQDLQVGGSFSEVQSFNGTKFTLTTDVSEVAGRDPQLLRRVVVTVNWSERSGPKEAVVETYITAVKR